MPAQELPDIAALGSDRRLACVIACVCIRAVGDEDLCRLDGFAEEERRLAVIVACIHVCAVID